MKEAREHLISTMDKFSKGKVPQKAADVMHKLGHSTAMNEFAESRAVEVMGNIETAAMLDRVQKNLEDIEA